MGKRVCSVCGVYFPSQRAKNTHYKAQHVPDEEDTEEEDEPEVITVEPHVAGIYIIGETGRELGEELDVNDYSEERY